MSLLRRVRETPKPTAPVRPNLPAQPLNVADMPEPPSEEPQPTPAIQALAVNDEALRQLRRSIVEQLSATVDASLEVKRTPKTVRLLSERFFALYQQSGAQLSEAQQKHLFERVLDELVGFGPIQPLLDDATVSEVMVNGPDLIYYEHKGKVLESPVRFDDDAHVMRVVERIIRPLGRRVDRKTPMVDARLPDGSRVNIIIPPSALNGPTITIRKFPLKWLSVGDLIAYGSLTPPMAEFLRACVVSRLNVVVSGGTGSGKTTLLNVLSSYVPSDERIVTIEDAAELQLQQKHVVRLESKPAELDGSGQVSIRDLVKNSLRMRPERIIVGEVRDGAALDMLQAMNTGHDGSLTTVHANSPRECTGRLETLCLMAGLDLPARVIREQIASAIDLIIQQARLSDGSRKITYITEVSGMEEDVIVLQDIFKYQESGRDARGGVLGEIRPTGLRPRFTPRLEQNGFKLPPEIFGVEEFGPRRR